MVARNQSSIVREIAFDQPGRELDRADFETGITITKTKRDLVSIADHTGQFFQRTTRHEHLLPFAENSCAGQVTHRQTVRVGRDKAKTVFFGSHEHASENRARIIA